MTTISNGETGASVRAKLNAIWEALELNPIDASIADTAVDVFVYRTSKDSDGGAWRKRTQHTSWYNETLNTSTRGSRKEFPAVAVIVAESSQVTIYDGDDPALPMWMVFNEGNFNNLVFGFNSLSAKNGIICSGNSEGNINYAGLMVVRFVVDDLIGIRKSNYSNSHNSILGVVNRNSAWPQTGSRGLITSGGGLVSVFVNDVAMTVLPDAPIDPATGLPVPTIAVATDGGVSVIKDDGTVVDATFVGSRNYISKVGFTADNWVFATVSNVTSPAGWFPVLFEIPSADISTVGTSSGGNGVGFTFLDAPYINTTQYEAGTDAVASDQTLFLGKTIGFWQIPVVPDDTLAVMRKNMVSKITSDYNTGWMVGDIKGAFLSDTDDSDLVGGTDADRSVNGNDLTVNGTVTRTAVATGADLVAYSGFSASNYLEQPYNSDLDFGTGDFCVMAWARDTNVGYIIDRSTSVGGERRYIYILSDGTLGTNLGPDGQGSGLADGSWHHICVARKDGVSSVYTDGFLAGAAAFTGNVVGTSSPVLRIGTRYNGSDEIDALALLRISATAPSADQIAKIYDDEKILFQENAQATLYGASDAVKALAHDDVTDLLHVGTSAGRSDFKGLRRVSNTTSAVSTAISASNGLIVEQ